MGWCRSWSRRFWSTVHTTSGNARKWRSECWQLVTRPWTSNMCCWKARYWSPTWWLPDPKHPKSVQRSSPSSQSELFSEPCRQQFPGSCSWVAVRVRRKLPSTWMPWTPCKLSSPGPWVSATVVLSNKLCSRHGLVRRRTGPLLKGFFSLVVRRIPRPRLVDTREIQEVILVVFMLQITSIRWSETAAAPWMNFSTPAAELRNYVHLQFEFHSKSFEIFSFWMELSSKAVLSRTLYFSALRSLLSFWSSDFKETFLHALSLSGSSAETGWTSF